MPKILLIDDSSFARKNLRRLLNGEYEYLEASDGLSGLEAYFLHHPDLVILDITMPGVNGLEVLEQLRKLDPQARVVVCSADVQEYTRQTSAELGACAFIPKPVDGSSLNEIVQTIFQDKE